MASSPPPPTPAPAPAALPTPSRLALLPPFLAREILRSAVSHWEQSKLTSVDAVHSSRGFRDLASVSKEWRALALDTESSVALSTLVLQLHGVKRRGVVEMRRQLTLQRACLLTLDVQRLYGSHRIGVAQWEAALSCVSKLQEVRLNQLKNVDNAQLGEIVEAAARQCRALESLVVSPAHHNNGETLCPAESIRRQLTHPMYVAMEQVWKNSKHVGLKRLCASQRFDLQGLATTREYLEKVVEFCPNLEIFDGYRAAVFAIDQRTCYEQWTVDLPLWEQFCAALTKLTEFSWICVPFATKFFEVFGQHAKPQLKSLRITTPMNWNWNQYHQQVGEATSSAIRETRFGGTAKNAHAVIRACPNLRELMVNWYNPVAEDDHRHMTRSSQRFPRVKMMDPEIFGDDFARPWRATARC